MPDEACDTRGYPACLERLTHIETLLETSIRENHERFAKLETAVDDPKNGLVKIVERHSTTIAVLKWVVGTLVAVATAVATAWPFVSHILSQHVRGEP